MKSEHRHDLKTNDLAKSLLTFQDYVKVYGGRVVLGIAIIILIIVLIIQRSSRSRDEAVRVRDDLAYVVSQIDRLERAQVGPDGRVTVRPAEADQVRRLIQEIRDKTSDKKVLAETMLAQGDYAWALSNYPDVPGAATQPSLKPEKPRPELLKEAKDSYQEVVKQYADQPMAVLRAHFGLAAVAENEHNWDDAKRELEAVKAIPDAGPTNIEYANLKLKRLDDLRKPLLIGEVPDKEPEKPAVTLPSVINPSTKATTQESVTPATKTAPPTTKPAGSTKPAA